MKNNKLPKWVLLDQYHIDIEIRTDMPAKLRKAINLGNMRDLRNIITTLLNPMMTASERDQVRIKISR